MLKILLGSLAGAVLLAAGSAGAVQVYESEADDGSMSGARMVQTDGSATFLNLYVVNPAGSTPSGVGTECSGTGTGDEVCGVDLLLTATGSLSIDGFVADPNADVVFNLTPGSVRFNFGNPFTGQLGPIRVATIQVSATDVGALTVTSGTWVGSALTANGIANAGAVIAQASPCVDPDADNICLPQDPCPTFTNTVPPTPGVIPGECLCGDTDQNGVHEFGDALTIIQCANGTLPPASCTPFADLYDTNGNGVAEFSDALDVIQASNGTATVPTYTYTCGRRPEGTPPP